MSTISPAAGILGGVTTRPPHGASGGSIDRDPSSTGDRKKRKLSLHTQKIPSLARLRPGATLRAVILVAVGTAGAQAILIVATPILTRIYGPEAFGALGSVIALTGIIGPVAGLCLPLATVLAKRRQEVGALAIWSASIAIVPAILTALAAPAVLQGVITAGVSAGVLVAATAALVYGSVLYQLMHQALLRSQRFKLVSAVTVSQAILFVGLQVAIGLLYPSPTALVSVSALNFLLFVVVALLLSSDARGQVLPTLRAAGDFLQVLRRYRDFSLYRAPQLLVNAIGAYLPILILTWYVDLAWVGFLVITQRILGLPTQLIGKSITDVLYPKFSILTSEGQRLGDILTRWTLTCFAIGMALSVVILLGAEKMYVWALGHEWGDGAVLAKVLVPWMLGALISRPAVAAVPVLNLQKHYLLAELATSGGKSLTLLTLLNFGGGVGGSMLVWSLVSATGSLYITSAVLFRSRSARPN